MTSASIKVKTLRNAFAAYDCKGDVVRSVTIPEKGGLLVACTNKFGYSGGRKSPQ
jgi:hypothetical protein